ncbi:MAG: hypothetical protein HZA22_11700, partial [Nitrospirae bacterium]|nr:hypothetical protein [Nitrospirota bacterium]
PRGHREENPVVHENTANKTTARQQVLQARESKLRGVIALFNHRVNNMNTKKYDIISINNDTKRPEKSSRFISYDIYDDNGSVIGDIIDYGRDGQPDFKTLYGDGKSQKPKEFAVWYGGEWRTLIQKGKPYGLVIDGRFRRYHIKDNHVVLAD